MSRSTPTVSTCTDSIRSRFALSTPLRVTDPRSDCSIDFRPTNDAPHFKFDNRIPHSNHARVLPRPFRWTGEGQGEGKIMSEIIYPRSPRETMDGWMHLPRYVDKIRLHLAGKLHSDYTENFGIGFDGMWLKYAGVKHEQMIELVKKSITDGEVCDWVHHNVKKTAADRAVHANDMLNRPKPGDDAAAARLKMRKEQAGMAHRDDIKNFVDFIDADEKRI